MNSALAQRRRRVPIKVGPELTARAGIACAAWTALLLVGTLRPFEGDLPAAAAVALLGWLAVFLPRVAAAAFAGGVVAVLFSPELLPWALAAALAHTLLVTRASAHAIPVRLDSDLQRQLMRSRRRDEPAAVLVVSVETEPEPVLADLAAGLRATDALEIVGNGDRWELRAVLDGEAVDREAVERRVVRVTCHPQVQVGWAEFPVDGMTLEVLVEHARAGLTAPAGMSSMVMASG